MTDKLDELKKQLAEIEQQIKLEQLIKEQELIQKNISQLDNEPVKVSFQKNNIKQETYKGRIINSEENLYHVSGTTKKFQTIEEAKSYIDSPHILKSETITQKHSSYEEIILTIL